MHNLYMLRTPLYRFFTRSLQYAFLRFRLCRALRSRKDKGLEASFQPRMLRFQHPTPLGPSDALSRQDSDANHLWYLWLLWRWNKER
jgi:hypothetical protein